MFISVDLILILSVSSLQMPLNESNVVETARRLLVYTIDAANFSDKMDIIFVAEMIEKIGKFVEKFKDVSGCTLLKDVLQVCPPTRAGCYIAVRDKCINCCTAVCCQVVK